MFPEYLSVSCDCFFTEVISTALSLLQLYHISNLLVIQGELVYANYGRYEDFEELKSNYGINVSGKIVIVKYGKLYRGDKVSSLFGIFPIER